MHQILTIQRNSKIAIGGMDKVYQYCQALKFRNEAASMCCASGKVVLSPLSAPPEPLLSLLTGNSDESAEQKLKIATETRGEMGSSPINRATFTNKLKNKSLARAHPTLQAYGC